jgi:hypothetical protein
MSCDDFYLVERTMYMNVSDEHRDAEVRNLAHLARSGRARGSHFVCGTLFWLGQHLVRWGQHLQRRHSNATSAPGRQSASPLAS